MSTLTFYPDANVESTSVDGDVQRSIPYPTPGSDTLANIRAGDGTNNLDYVNVCVLNLSAYQYTDKYSILSRIITLYDTRSLPDDATISSATEEFCIENASFGDSFSDSLALVSSNPDSDTDLENDDYGRLGSTRLATDLTFAGFTHDSATFNAFTLNGDGLAAISKTGITKLGRRLVSDLDNSNSWSSSPARTLARCLSAEETVTGDKRPKLVVVFTVPFTPKVIMF
jgi:hypothetical protein